MIKKKKKNKNRVVIRGVQTVFFFFALFLIIPLKCNGHKEFSLNTIMLTKLEKVVSLLGSGLIDRFA